jgi:tetratricopeptide (TPR) repeat protein
MPISTSKAHVTTSHLGCPVNSYPVTVAPTHPPITPMVFTMQSPSANTNSRPNATSDTKTLFRRAMTLHIRGELGPARQLYLRLLEIEPDHAHAIHSIGLIAHASPTSDCEPSEWLRRAVALRPDQAEFHHNLAQALRAKGCLNEAVTELQAAIALKPSFLGAWRALASTQCALGNADAAEKAQKAAEELQNSEAEAHLARSIGSISKGEAKLACDALLQAIACNPRRSEFYQLLGNVQHALGNDLDANVSFEQAAQLARLFGPQSAAGPKRDVQTTMQRALSLFHQGRFADVAHLCEQVLRLDPSHRDALHFLGINALRNQQFEVAAELLMRAVAVNPLNAAAYSHLSLAMFGLKRLDEALGHSGRALAIRPDYPSAICVRGNILAALGRYEEALKEYDDALRIQPKNHQILLCRCDCLSVLGLHEEALSSCELVSSIDPNNSEVFGIKANVLIALGRRQQAIEAIHVAVALARDDVTIQFVMGLNLLSLGLFSEGWPLYELRLKDESHFTPSVDAPRWQAEPLAGRSILLVPEQGFGDEIQFCRYVPYLKSRGATRVTLVCRPALVALFRTLPGVDAVYAQDNQEWQRETYDFWVHLLSLPLLCGTTLESIPKSLPYLSAPKAHVRNWTGRVPTGGIKIGLIWKGNRNHGNDSHRSLATLATLLPLWAIGRDDITFVSLQTGSGGDEALQSPPEQPILPLGADLEDFADTAAVLSLLDLVICVDTAIAHLAGAMDVPCWVLLTARKPDWRWMHDRADSPWYSDKMRIFRQRTPDDWTPVIQEIAIALKDLH